MRRSHKNLDVSNHRRLDCFIFIKICYRSTATKLYHNSMNVLCDGEIGSQMFSERERVSLELCHHVQWIYQRNPTFYWLPLMCPPEITNYCFFIPLHQSEMAQTTVALLCGMVRIHTDAKCRWSFYQLIRLWEIYMEFQICNCQGHFSNCWVRYLLWIPSR